MKVEQTISGVKSPTVYIKTLGCKVNSFDSHAIANQFERRGYNLVEDVASADIAVINSCSVTENADKEARYLARRYRRDRPDTFLVVTGCYAQTNSATLDAIQDIDFIVPNEAKANLVPLVEESFAAAALQQPYVKIAAGLKPVTDNRQQHFKSSLTLFDHAESAERSRVFVKIQDGCNGFCTYCLIPYARGQSRSVETQLVLDEVSRLMLDGVPEIVLTGIHIGDYGEDQSVENKISLLGLLQKFEDFAGSTRFRISSLEPGEVSEDLIRFMFRESRRYCEHFHLPLQSGNDDILKKMRRQYSRQEYSETLSMISSYVPDVSLGADVICGFPGETDEQFVDTLDFIKKCRLSYLHVFPYSKRPNTAAAKFADHLPVEVVQERRKVLQALSKELAQTFARNFLARKVEIVWNLGLDLDGRRTGVSREYLQVKSQVNLDENLQKEKTSKMIVAGFIDESHLLVRPNL
ncbi:MAG: tRNA (N(6)-L-threonylcarbamoyladenosine(37)-C(2))-methylthiotransferase MtaB [Oligoflexales bacterium]|nr:tRNA (N(6)-L-threonylcarbamoyladenosine(37)-C(2))-methylthiotransferase MtaB [Oligoflexales bacterium]